MHSGIIAGITAGRRRRLRNELAQGEYIVQLTFLFLLFLYMRGCRGFMSGCSYEVAWHGWDLYFSFCLDRINTGMYCMSVFLVLFALPIECASSWSITSSFVLSLGGAFFTSCAHGH